MNALHTQFKSAIHLRCFLHFRGNLEDKLADIGISKANAQEFLKDVFRSPALLEIGLVDTEVTELDKEFGDLKDAWDKCEVAFSGTAIPSFHQWLERNCLEEVRNCMLKDKREQAGLGSPPEPFYTIQELRTQTPSRVQATTAPGICSDHEGFASGAKTGD